MSDPEKIVQPVKAPADAVEKAIARVAGMNVEEIRSEWRKIVGSNPPPAFSKDLLARGIAYPDHHSAHGKDLIHKRIILSPTLSSSARGGRHGVSLICGCDQAAWSFWSIGSRSLRKMRRRAQAASSRSHLLKPVRGIGRSCLQWLGAGENVEHLPSA
jgi:hypothetical protein